MIPRQLVILTAVMFAIAIVMGIYLVQLRRRETSSAPVASEAQHVTPPAAGPAEKITVWVAHDDNGSLREQSIAIPFSSGRQQRADELMRALLNIYLSPDSPHRLGPGAEVRDVYLVDPGLAVVDLNAAFADGQTSGVLAEELTIVSMVQTLATNVAGLTRVKFLVDGKERDTLAGHMDLSGFYDVAQVSELAKQFSVQ